LGSISQISLLKAQLLESASYHQRNVHRGTP
jgi:hypothetical protein